MPYKFEEELRDRAESFTEALAEAGFEGAIVPGSFHDYMVKVSVQRTGQHFGHVNLYYSPKKDQFTLKTHELKNKAVIPDLKACWDRLTLLDTTAGLPSTDETGYQLYTDGSWLDGAIGYGVVILKDGNVISELSGPAEEEALKGMRQVGGELRALYKAVDWCQENHVEEVEVFYDYAGIEKWATGEWKANNPATRAYAEFMGDCPISVRWRKVEGHSGDRWNERADQLAKLGAKQGAPEAERHQDATAELSEKARAFVEHLEEEGVAASFLGVVNNQFGRIAILPKRGYVDLYDTKKRPLSAPYLHGFSDHSLQVRIEGLWKEFLTGEAGPESRAKGVLAEATYYFEILEPYSDCNFDFHALAQVLERACRQLKHPEIDVDSARYDFGQLRTVYSALQEETEAS